MRQDGWITHIQRYCYSTAGLPWGPEKRGGGGKGGGEAYRRIKLCVILFLESNC